MTMTTQLPAPGLSNTTAPTDSNVFGGTLQQNIVMLRNVGAEDFDRKYGPHQRLRIPVGQQVAVMEEIAWHFVGRWWTNNNNPRDRKRVKEFTRLREFYGAYDDAALWEQNRPRLEVWTMDGRRILSVIDDPDGIESGASTATELGRQMTLEQQVEQLTGALQQMQAQLDQQLAQGAAMQSAPPPPLDTAPPTIPAAPVTTANVGGMDLPVAPTEVTMVDGVAVDEDAIPRLPVHAAPVDVSGDAPPPVDSPPRATRVGHS